MERLRAAVIGLGFIGFRATSRGGGHPVSHVAAYKALPNLYDLVACCDVDEAKVKTFKRYNRKIDVFRNHIEMMEAVEPDVVSVCTPVQTHAGIIYDLVKFKPKAIFCEKPLAHNIDACKEVVKVCKMNNVILAVNFTRRWDEVYRKIKEIVSGGRLLGSVTNIVGYASRERDFEGNIHMFDLLNWLSDGCWRLCTYIDCYPSDYLIFELDVLGEKGRLRFTDNGRKLNLYLSTESSEGGHYGKELDEIKLPKELKYSFPDAMLNAFIDLAKCVRTGKRPECDGEKALETQLFYERWKKNRP